MAADSYSLRITRQPPSQVYPNEWMELELTVGKEQDVPSESDQLSLQASVHLHDGRLPARDACPPNVAQLIVDPSTPLVIELYQSLTKKTALVKCKIEAAVSNSTPLNVCICVSLQCNGNHVSNAYTSPIHMVNYKLRVEPKDWEDAWYKDEGGRDKCMLAEVELRSPDGSLARGVRAPLRLTLRYADVQSTQVKNQEILRILGHPKQYIDPDTGTASIRFRIEDVSKNHQGQDFKVEILADSSRFGDIAPIFTPTVSVRSKRSKRQRIAETSASSQSQQPSFDDVAQPKRTILEQQQQLLQQQPIALPHLAIAAHTSPFAAEFQGLKNPNVNSASSRYPVAGVVGSTEFSDAARTRDALQGIIAWADDVVNGLYPLQWKLIGYAPFPDGSLDHNHPYYSMTNPNACISKLLSTYSSSVRDDLRVLMAEADVSLARKNAEMEAMSARREQEMRLPPLRQYDFSNPESNRMSLLAQGASYDARMALVQHHQQLPGGISAFDSSRMSHSIPPQSQQQQPSVLNNPYNTPSMMRHELEEESIEELEDQVTYVLAKQYKSLRSGQRLGFPAFNADRQIIGFFQDSASKIGMERFIPIRRLANDFGAVERDQAAQILRDAIESRSEALHCIKNYDSVTSLLASALVYDWSNKGTEF